MALAVYQFRYLFAHNLGNSLSTNISPAVVSYVSHLELKSLEQVADECYAER
jgi:hypothetical protein